MGMSGGSGPRGTMSEINVTPLVDVMLVLLIIFMVTAPLMNSGVEIDLPWRSDALLAAAPPPIPGAARADADPKPPPPAPVPTPPASGPGLLRAALLAPSTRLDFPDAPRAAVAAIFTPTLELLFMRRAEVSGDPWSGHLAFPGGRVDPTDRDDLHAAMRETEEAQIQESRLRGLALHVSKGSLATFRRKLYELCGVWTCSAIHPPCRPAPDAPSALRRFDHIPPCDVESFTSTVKQTPLVAGGW